MSMTIREATPEDIPDIASIHVAGWQGAYGNIIDQSYIESKTLDSRVKQWEEIFTKDESDTVIAVIDGKATGFISYGPLRTAPPGTSKIRPLYSSEIYAIYLLPDYYRQGIGTKLLQTSAENLKTQKHQSTCLWVLKDNKNACGFYEAMGGQRIGKIMAEFGPTKALEVCYGWRDIEGILKP